MDTVRVTIRLKRSEDAALVQVIEGMAPGDRNKSLKRALEDSLIHGPTLAQAVSDLAQAVHGLKSDPAHATAPGVAPSPPDRAARTAALLGPFQQQIKDKE